MGADDDVDEPSVTLRLEHRSVHPEQRGTSRSKYSAVLSNTSYLFSNTSYFEHPVTSYFDLSTVTAQDGHKLSPPGPAWHDAVQRTVPW